MAEFETFPHPPIKEAIVGIWTAPPLGAGVADLDAFTARISTAFPIKETRYRYEGGMQFDKGELTTLPGQKAEHGLLYRSETSKHVLQILLEGTFLFSVLQPYVDWSSTRMAAQKWWDEFQAALPARHVEKLSLRYINLIPLPADAVSISEYFLTHLDIAPGIPPNIEDMFLKFTLFDEKQDIRCATTMTVVNQEGARQFVFDIDVSKSIACAADDPALWTGMDRLRDFKNHVFHNSITEKTKALFR